MFTGGGVMVANRATAEQIVVGAHLDVRNVEDIRNALNAALARPDCDVVVDMRDVVMIDAAGLGMLTAAHLRAERAGRRLLLRYCSDDIRRVFAVTHLNRVFHIDRSFELLA
jgi:anti-sigma B factor antagonist